MCECECVVCTPQQSAIPLEALCKEAEEEDSKEKEEADKALGLQARAMMCMHPCVDMFPSHAWQFLSNATHRSSGQSAFVADRMADPWRICRIDALGNRRGAHLIHAAWTAEPDKVWYSLSTVRVARSNFPRAKSLAVSTACN